MSAEEDKILSYKNVPVRVAAEYLGVSLEFVRSGIERGFLPFGVCVTGSLGRRSFFISPNKLIEFAKGKKNDRPGAVTPERSGG